MRTCSARSGNSSRLPAVLRSRAKSSSAERYDIIEASRMALMHKASRARQMERAAARDCGSRMLVDTEYHGWTGSHLR